MARIDEDDLEEILDDYLPGASVKDLLNLVGAPDGSKVTIRQRDQQIVVDVDFDQAGKSVSAVRIIRRERGKTFLWNLKILVEPSGKQIGLDMFRRQVDTAISLGVQEIQCIAEKGQGLNGYYTWAVFGYQSKLVDSDKILTQQGRDEWKAKGQPFHGVFDLRSGSKSRHIFDRYYGQQMQERNRENR